MKYEFLTEEQAIGIAETRWWKDKDLVSIVRFQLFTPLLCMDFSDFHEAVEKVLGRPVFTHEFGLNYEGLMREFSSIYQQPTLEEVLNVIPSSTLASLGIAP